MKKYILFVLLGIGIIVAYWLISPLFINKKVTEDSPINSSVNTREESTASTTAPVVDLELTTTKKGSSVISTPTIVASGNFSGFDKTHYGSGTANLIQTSEGLVLRFENDFNVANGPDLYVGFGTNGSYIKGSDLAKLKGNIGSQNYILPADFDITKTNEVWIWCKAFSVPFAKAVLSAQS